MTKNIVRFATVMALAMLLALLTSCGTSKPARFYKMYPTVAELARPSPKTVASANMSVVVGPVEVPAYLDRPQIVTRKAGSEIGYAEYDRWAGSLQGNIADVLVEDISSTLAGEGVSVHPWALRVPFDYRVQVRIHEFEGYPGKSVKLNAAWTVIAPAESKVIVSRRSVIEKDVQGQGYAAYVDAMNGALAELSRQISDVLHALHAGGTAPQNK